jgi:Tfp pilus assembly protein PilF
MRQRQWRWIGRAIGLIGALSLVWTTAPAQNGSSGVAAFEAHRYDEAKRELEVAVRSDPDNARAHHFLGRIAYHETRFNDAISHFRQASDLEPSLAEHQIWLGRAYGQMAVRSGLAKKFGMAKRARTALERAVELDPSSLDARSGLIQFYLLAPGLVGGSMSKARHHAGELAKRSAFRGALARAWIAEDRGEHDQAAREYRDAISREPDSLVSYWGLAQLWQRAERFDSAFALIDGLIARKADAMPAYYYLGRAAGLSGQRLDDGVRALHRYLAYEPREGDPPRSSAHYRLGLVYERMGDRVRAKREYEASLALEPTRGEVKTALGRVK